MKQNMKAALSAHINKLKKQEEEKPRRTGKDNLLFLGTSFDTPYLPHLKPCVGAHTTFVRTDKVSSFSELEIYCSKRDITKVISTSVELLKKLLYWDKKAAPKLSNYAGSYFKLPKMVANSNSPDIEIVFIQPLKQLVTVNYGKFMATRTISKLINPNKWFINTEFNWEIMTPSNWEQIFRDFYSAFLISIDIETYKEDAVINCISYTAFFYSSKAKGGITSKTVVLPLEDYSQFVLTLMRKFNWELPAPKVFQNGKYDISYLSRYNAPVYNYCYDTANMFHCWYSELPKDLGFLNSFCIREAFYWKDLAETSDKYEYYKYNGLDSWGTGNALLAMLIEIPDYVITNYILEFPLTFPCHLSEMIGIARDTDKLQEVNKEYENFIDNEGKKLDKILGVTNFNVKSPKQVKSVLKLLGCGDLPSTDKKNLEKARFRHPFNARIITSIKDIREHRTIKENYLQVGEKAEEFYTLDKQKTPRILYTLNPHGTDSSRLASKKHHFWLGANIQKIPRGKIVKQTLKADPGFYIAEADLEQAESRDTAYIAGEENLINAVEYSPDFHSANASAFFGTPFEKIFDPITCTVLDKALRDLAKRVNHGANYNMGAYVLIDTMGEAKIVQAKKLLELPRFWGYLAVAEYLLGVFHDTYPGIKQVFYTGVIEEVTSTKMLVSKALHHHEDMGELYGKELTDEEYEYWYSKQGGAWTRYCFGKPDRNKLDLNSYVSHPPQSLNAQTLNKAYMKVFKEIVLHKEHRHNFKLLAQIHDSILFQYRQGHDYLCSLVKEAMEIPITIKGYDDKLRTFTVPASVKAGKNGEPAVYWSMTE